MDILLSALLFVNGAMLAWITIDFATRKSLSNSLENKTQEYQDTMRKLSESHNEMANKMIDLGDKVSAHQYQLTAKVTPKSPMQTNPFVQNKR